MRKLNHQEKKELFEIFKALEKGKICALDAIGMLDKKKPIIPYHLREE